jgi:hypothetical protein
VRDPDLDDTTRFFVTDYFDDSAKTFSVEVWAQLASWLLVTRYRTDGICYCCRSAHLTNQVDSGQILVNQDYLNFETNPFFQYTVRVLDSGGLFADVLVNIQVSFIVYIFSLSPVFRLIAYSLFSSCLRL